MSGTPPDCSEARTVFRKSSRPRSPFLCFIDRRVASRLASGWTSLRSSASSALVTRRKSRWSIGGLTADLVMRSRPCSSAILRRTSVATSASKRGDVRGDPLPGEFLRRGRRVLPAWRRGCGRSASAGTGRAGPDRRTTTGGRDRPGPGRTVRPWPGRRRGTPGRRGRRRGRSASSDLRSSGSSVSRFRRALGRRGEPEVEEDVEALPVLRAFHQASRRRPRGGSPGR